MQWKCPKCGHEVTTNHGVKEVVHRCLKDRKYTNYEEKQ
jgi:predicted RNA-binding Zn-ribbon protein involved in translation (DUF1610 family)